MPTHTLTPATRADALYIADRLRQADIAEAEALGIEAGSSLRAFYPDKYRLPLVMKVDGEPYAIGAASEPQEGISAIWGVGTDLVDRYPRAFCRLAHAAVQQWRTVAPVVANMVHSKNTLHVRWIEWEGFQFHPEVTLPNGEVFLPFSMRS